MLPWRYFGAIYVCFTSGLFFIRKLLRNSQEFPEFSTKIQQLNTLDCLCSAKPEKTRRNQYKDAEKDDSGRVWCGECYESIVKERLVQHFNRKHKGKQLSYATSAEVIANSRESDQDFGVQTIIN